MHVWLARLLSVAWAGFWFWFGVAWAVHEHLPWYRVLASTFRPGFIFVAIALAGWFWPRAGGVFLVLTGFGLASWYAINFGHAPTNTKLFVLSTWALPPLLAGLLLLVRGVREAKNHDSRAA